MLIFQGKLSRSISQCLEPSSRDLYSERELLYFDKLAKPEGSKAARILMKEILRDFFQSIQMSRPPATLEILPEGFSETQTMTGPPCLHFVNENPLPGFFFHLSMSHSSSLAMAALVVLQKETHGTDSLR